MSLGRAVALASFGLALGACGKAAGSSAPSSTERAGESSPQAAASGDTAAAAPTAGSAVPAMSAAAPGASADIGALRRAYGPTDMKLDGCAKVEDGVIRGRHCTATFSIFGPYVAVPSKSQVQVSFKILAPENVTVFTDVVSDLGRRYHASILDQPIPAKERRPVGYRVNFFEDATALEARVGVRGEGPVDFDISDFVVDVR